ncbi:glycosyl hydrolase family 18 protein [Flavobacterium sp. N502540]|uniref:glycosyl hydrolase family 18 protein n=1 Tax=Flavobacterium sp. N502540 TaxID=2986838 RepID=UPI00222577B3|nr:glycosyl hydrolase family 18 protein [Flavobacterium sp. N502540]
MRNYYRLLVFLLFPLLVLAQPAHGKKVVGYYAQWAIYARDFNVPKIDGNKLTHLNYSFFGTDFDPAHPENTKLKSLDTYADFDHMEGGIPWDAPVKGNFYDLKKLKEKYPHLKILISVGGWTKGQDLSPIAASPVARAALAADMANFIVTYPFIDGFDIDWEYPVKGGTDGTEIINGALIPAQKHSPDDNKNLVYLLKAMRQVMPNKLITIAAGNNVRDASIQYLGPNNRTQYGMTEDISTYCDYITYFGYDFGGNWYDKTCYNAPLYASGNANDPLYGAAQSESLDELTSQYLNVIGFPASKLIMGLPFYGKKFEHVANNGNNPSLPGLFVSAPRDVVPGCTNPQPPTGTWDTPAACEKSGSIEICDLVGNPVTNSHAYLDPNTMLVTPAAAAAGWVRYFDNTTKVPYLYNTTLKQFITYEDKQSIDLKVQYIKSRNLAGGMIWEISQDTRGTVPNSLLTQVDTSFGSIVLGTVSITGSVKNGTALLTSVTVELRDDSNAVLQTLTSATGNFTFNNLTSGQNYKVTAAKTSYTFTPVNLANVTTNQTGIAIQGTQIFYTASGTVLDGTTPVSGVVVSATSGGATFTGVSNASGTYSISLPSGADYTVTAASPGYSYTPASTVYTNLMANQTLNLRQSVVVPIISGTIKKGSVAVSGAKVELTLPWTDNTHPYQVKYATTNAEGKYSFDNAVLAGYTTVTSLKLNAWENGGLTYLPSDLASFPIPAAPKTYDFNTNAINPTYYTISGTVLNGTTAVSGVTVTATDVTTVLTAVSDTSGNYGIANLVSGANYTVTVAKAGLSFTPVSTVYNAINSNKTLNFTQVATPVYYTVSGTVLDGTTSIQGVTVTATSTGGTFTGVSNASGTYSISLPSGADYTMTAAKSGLSFTPVSTVYNNLTANKTLNFSQDVIVAGVSKISGTVKNGSVPVSGAKVELILPWTDNSHPYMSKIATTDAQGKYSFDNTILAGYTTISSLKMNAWENNNVVYSPTNLTSFAVPTNPTVYDFNTNVVTPTYTVSGTVLNGTAPVAGVTVTATDGTTVLTAVSDTSGNYSIANLVSGANYTVTAAKSGLSFTPVSTVYAVINSNKILNFTQIVAPIYYTVSGTVLNGTTAIAGVTISATSGTTTLTSVSDASGNYSIANLISGTNYTVTAAKSGLSFTPVSTVYSAINSNKTLNFTQIATPVYYTVSGTVLNGTTAVGGVTISATSGTTTLTSVSDASGNYVIANLVAGLDYIITAAKAGLTFSPGSTIYTAISANKILNFTQNISGGALISGTVKSGSTPIAGAKVELILPWTDSTHGYVSIMATTDASGNFSYNNSALAGYTTVASLKLNVWENSNVVYSPTNLASFAMPVTPQVYNFNSSSVAPQVTITSPSLATVAIVPGTVIQLKANASLTFADPTVSISSVIFNINGQNITGTLATGTEYVANWTPAVADFNKNYTLKATATASNSVTAENTKAFYLQCSGASCPNVLPEIAWITPASTTINQVSGFQPVPVSVNVTDTDGTVASVSISIDGVSFPMTKGTGTAYNYTFTPNTYKNYAIVVTATDNAGGVKAFNQSISIISSSFNPLPAKVILGYAHAWDNDSAPFLYFNQLGDKKFNVVVYAFIETVNRDGYTPVLVINKEKYGGVNSFNPQLLKDDIKFLRDKGIPVIVSIGGQNGHVELNTVAQKDVFVKGLKEIIDYYNFDGVDIDFEGTSMDFGAGVLTDFSYASISAYPKLKNVVDAFKELKANYGSGFILTAAPEAYYVQGGYSNYGNRPGSFLPVIYNLRKELDLLMVQLYNSGSILGLDNVAYSQATPNFLTSMSEMLMKGFNVATTGFYFQPLPQSKIMFGLPACTSAAGGGYLTAEKGIQAFDYLTKGTTFPGRTYTLKGGPYPDLRGVMTWSINWDASSCGNSSEFSKAYAAYFASQSASKKMVLEKIEPNGKTVVYFKNDVLSVTNDSEDIAQVDVFNTIGQLIVNYKNVLNNKEVLLHDHSFSTRQLFVVVVTDSAGNKKSIKVMNFLN